MKYLSVCSGIEAASVAWHGLGWTPVAFAEIERFPSQVLAHHYPNVPNLGDMTRFKEWKFNEPIDLLVGGTPCQSFSVAGLRKGMDDPRGNLALTFLAIVDRFRPRWVLWENVPGVLSSWSDEETAPASARSLGDVEAARQACRDAGLDPGSAGSPGQFEECVQSSDFDCFTAGLGQLGYGWAYRELDAQYFGVAQRRRRVFVVGHSGGRWQRAAAVLFEPESLRGDSPPSREQGKGIAGTISSRPTGGGGLGTDFDLGGGSSVARQLLAKGKSSHREDMETYIAHTLKAEGFDASEDGTGRGIPLVCGTLSDGAHNGGGA